MLAMPHESFSAGVWSAANSLLARGYGNVAVKEEIEHIDLQPVVLQIKAPVVPDGMHPPRDDDEDMTAADWCR